MSLREKLGLFSEAISSAIINPPDEYAEWKLEYYANQNEIYLEHMKEIKELWSYIKPKLKKDLEKAELVDEKPQEMFAAFDAGEKEKGREIAFDIYISEVNKLR